MAKCSICNSRKGKRHCRISDTYICSLCCSESRKADTCTGCNHYRDPRPQNKYKDLPMFPLQRMANDPELESYANLIEGTLCAFDRSVGKQITDKTALRILELLLDKYYFKNSIILPEDELLEKGFTMLEIAIDRELSDISDEIISRIIGTIYFVARRRSKGNREYLDFIHDYVELRIADEMRII